MTTPHGEADSADRAFWSPAPDELRLGEGEVHVWRAPLVQSAPRVEAFHALLSDDERQRAARFHFPVHRNHFVVARGLLRTLLGRYLEAPPAALRFSYSAFGKPVLTDETRDEAREEKRNETRDEMQDETRADNRYGALRFNVSHSGELALYAFTVAREVGVDIERWRADFAGLDIAERFFSPREVEALRALPESLRTHGFFNCWTRKEAYIKAHGEGLSLPLDKFDVTLAPGEPAQLLRTDHDPPEAARWTLRELSPAEGYSAAIAVEGHDWRLVCHDWAAKGMTT